MPDGVRHVRCFGAVTVSMGSGGVQGVRPNSSDSRATTSSDTEDRGPVMTIWLRVVDFMVLQVAGVLQAPLGGADDGVVAATR
ncbi:hypothetical protein CJ179_30710 [Rhodococcus sp. ACS1]|nr:hypothetical protein CJ179_30710 [Rhodococcus sp. ACS1]